MAPRSTTLTHHSAPPAGQRPRLTIPIDIWLIVRDTIDDKDLRTHACFYQSSSRVAAAYNSDTNPDGFWERLCTNCGLGLLPEDWHGRDGEDGPGMIYRDTALDVMSKEGFCTHPQCGEGLLAYNRKRMRVEYALLRRKGKETYDPNVDEGHSTAVHSVLAWRNQAITFHRDGTRLGVPLRNIPPRARLADHPLVARSFAVVLPLAHVRFTEVDLCLPAMQFALHGAPYVTVAQFARAIEERLGDVLSPEYLKEHPEISYRIGTNFLRVKPVTVGDVLKVFPVNGICSYRPPDPTAQPSFLINIEKRWGPTGMLGFIASTFKRGAGSWKG